jgi:hypothetical protein
MPIKDLLAKLKTLPAAIGIFFKETAEKFARADVSGKTASGVMGKVRDLSGKARKFARDKFPGTRERLIFAGSLAAVLLVLCMLILLAGGKSGSRRTEPQLSAARIVIPPEDLFLPEEPDFAPGILLERERRTSWTAEDAEPFWQDPLRNGEEQWRNRIETVIDDLLERVP